MYGTAQPAAMAVAALSQCHSHAAPDVAADSVYSITRFLTGAAQQAFWPVVGTDTCR